MDKLVIGCGYLGHRVAKEWHNQGHRVWAATRKEERAEEFRQQGWEPVLCDVLNPKSLTALPQVTTVLYAVGLDRSSGHSMREVYVEGLSNVLNHLPIPKKFLHISSTSVYGQSEGEEVDETAATEPVGENGQVVLEAERVVQNRIPHAMTLRFAGIYGPDRLMRKQAIATGEAFVCDPDVWLNLIHVEDGVRAVLAAEEHYHPGEIINISDDCPIKRREFYGLLALKFRQPLRMIPPSPEDRPKRGPNNRRILNRKMHEELHVELKYPSYIEGLLDVQGEK